MIGYDGSPEDAQALGRVLVGDTQSTLLLTCVYRDQSPKDPPRKVAGNYR